MRQLIHFIQFNGGEYVTNVRDCGKEAIVARCSYKHEFTMFIHSPRWCPICFTWSRLRMYNIYITPVTKRALEYSRIIFKCQKDHKFVYNNLLRSCPLCSLLNMVNSKFLGTYKIDCDSIYEDTGSLLRIKCVTKLQCAGCTACNPKKFPLAPHIRDEHIPLKCPNGIICNKEFIATPFQLMQYNNTRIYKHSTAHSNGDNCGITNSLRLFELLYEAKFNDVVDNKHVRFTGYNMKYGVAFIHCLDMNNNFPNHRDKVLQYIKRYCVNHKILLLIFPDNINNAADIIKLFVYLMNGEHIQNPPWEKYVPTYSSFILPNGKRKRNSDSYITKGILRVFKDNTKYGNLYGEYAKIGV